MTTSLSVECSVHFRPQERGRKAILPGPKPKAPAVPPGRVPRVARLLALAHRFEQLIRDGIVRDYAELARLGHVTRARMSQIMNLLNLAPDIQEALLDLVRTEKGRDAIHLRQLQPIAGTVEWRRQRRLWKDLLASTHEMKATRGPNDE
jgi:hypothetical protein